MFINIIREPRNSQPMKLVHVRSPSIVVIMSPLQLQACGEGRMFDPCGDHFFALNSPIVHALNVNGAIFTS